MHYTRRNDATQPPTGKCGNNGATVLVMRQIDQRREPQSDGPVAFEWPEWVTVRGKRISYGGQEAGVAPFHANGTIGDTIGETGLLVATPGGRHVFWESSDLGLSKAEPPVS